MNRYAEERTIFNEVGRLHVALVGEARPLRLQRLRLHLGLKTDGERNSDGFAWANFRCITECPKDGVSTLTANGCHTLVSKLKVNLQVG